MKRKSFYGLIFSMLLVFAFIASQGCGGSSSNKFSNNNNGGSGSVIVGGEVIIDDDDFDVNENGRPDFLDFDGVSITRMNSSAVDVQVPAMIIFDELNELGGTDAPDSISVSLQAGKEYTFEFSKNLTDPIESVLPSIEILDPVSNEPLSFLTEEESGESNSGSAIPDDRIQLSVYPEDKPSIICLTFRPSVTGKYTVRVSSANLSAIEEEDEEASASEKDTSCILFIYEELRNEKGEPGYYTRLKFGDDYGNRTDTVDISSIIEMRKLFLELRPNYMKNYLSVEPEVFTTEEFKELYSWITLIEEYYGVFEIDVSDDDITMSSASIVRPSATTNLNSTGSNIKTRMSGIPYRDVYTPGSGWFGLTGYDTTGSAIKSFTLPVPATKSVKATYKSDFISSQQEQEKFSNTTFGASFSIGGFGLNASVSSMSNYKFGLTSTTLVIHYDERETTPRILNDDAYQLTEAAEVQLGIRNPDSGSPSVQNPGYTNFRNLYGDYFVAGYTYGGTYDAFISITTETTEQLSQVKSQLGLKYNSLDKADPQAAAQIANETKDILNKYNASVSIEIRTSGSSANPTPTLPKGKNNVDSVGDVLAELIRFKSELSQQTPAQFVPFTVYLKRYSVLKPVLEKMNAEGNDGTVPIAPATATMIQDINRSLISLGGHHQVIAGLDNSKIDSAVRDDYDARYKRIIDKIETNPRFYNDANEVKTTLDEIKNLSKELKAIGDRYVFYKMLMASQSHERSMYDQYKAYEDDADDDDTHHQPFGGYGGGSTGYREFFVSTAVTNDINAGKSETLDGRQSYKAAGRRYWGTSDHNLDNVSASYTARTSAGGNDALFCYVSVEAENKSDCHRRFQNYPVAGKSNLDFDFKSGYSRDATWLVRYQTMQFTREKYPFFGLDR